MAAGRVTSDCQFSAVDIVFGGVFDEPLGGGVDIVDTGGPFMLWGESVADTDPCDTGVVEWFIYE